MSGSSGNRKRIFPNQSLDVSETSFNTSVNNSIESTKKSRVIQIVTDLFISAIIFIVFLLVYFLVDPTVVYFTCDQTDISYPHLQETVKLWVVGLFASLGPVIFFFIIELMNSGLMCCFKELSKMGKKQKFRQFLICFFHTCSLFVLGIATSLLLTEIGKRMIGRLRPHFLSVCNPKYSQLNCSVSTLSGIAYNSIYTGGSFCTGNADEIKEARLSFPSGHSSFSAYTMTFLIVYLEARLPLLRFRFLKVLIQILAFIGWYVTSMSRVSDYYHRGSDVIGGSVLGFVIALHITMVVGKVLWEYDRKPRVSELDLKPR